jgi:uroporphyrin-III C-methyltransferase/precorrin-2 dehydrogenase/sirohydrochlorin ferrochelatase
MGLRNVEALTREFVARGADPNLPAAIVDNATRPNQQVVVGTLGTLAAKARATELSGPSIIIVGTVVTLRNTLDWRPAIEPSHSDENSRLAAPSGKG